MLPHAGFPARSWGLLCLYAATVCALITRPIAPGALILISATTGTPSSLQCAGCPRRLRQRRGLVDRRGVSFLPRVHEDPAWRTGRLRDCRAARTQPAAARLLDRARRSRDGADDAVEHGTRRRHSL